MTILSYAKTRHIEKTRKEIGLVEFRTEGTGLLSFDFITGIRSSPGEKDMLMRDESLLDEVYDWINNLVIPVISITKEKIIITDEGDLEF